MKSKTVKEDYEFWEVVAATIAWNQIKPTKTSRVFEHADIYEFIGGHFTGGQWSYFLDGYRDAVVVDSSGVLTKHHKKHPAYLYAYQAGYLAREIVEAHDLKVT